MFLRPTSDNSGREFLRRIVTTLPLRCGRAIRGASADFSTFSFTLEYWHDEDWYVGQLREVAGSFSQGKTLRELKKNIRDAFDLVRSGT